MLKVLQHTRLAALDLGSENCRLVQLGGEHGSLTVREWRRLEGEAAALPLVPLGQAVPGRRVSLALSPPDVECCPLRVPEGVLGLEHQALIQAIRHEVGRHIANPVEQVELDAWPLPRSAAEGPNIMVAAAPKQALQGVLDWLDARSIQCSGIDVGPLAATRACLHLCDRPAEHQLWGVLDIGRQAVRLYVVIGETPVYVRCMLRGGLEMSRRIAAELGVELDVAESYKRHYGIGGTDDHYRHSDRAEQTVDEFRMAGILMGVLRPILRGIGEEVQRSFRYAMGLYPDHPLRDLLLIGAGAGLTGLPEALGQMLGIPVSRVTDERQQHAASPAAKETLPAFVTAVGAALGARP